MHSTYRARGRRRWAYVPFVVLAALGVSGVSYRIYRAMGLGLMDLLTSVAAVVLFSGAFATAWAMHVRKIRRAGAAQWEAARAKRANTLLEGEEDRALWDSVDPAESDEDTIAFGNKVVVLRSRPKHSRAS